MRFTKLKKDTIQSQQLIAFLREEILILEFKTEQKAHNLILQIISFWVFISNNFTTICIHIKILKKMSYYIVSNPLWNFIVDTCQYVSVTWTSKVKKNAAFLNLLMSHDTLTYFNIWLHPSVLKEAQYQLSLFSQLNQFFYICHSEKSNIFSNSCVN